MDRVAGCFLQEGLRNPQETGQPDVLVDVGPSDSEAEVGDLPVRSLRRRRAMEPREVGQGSADLAAVVQDEMQPIARDANVHGDGGPHC